MGTYLQPSSIEHPVLDSQELLTIGTTTLSTCTLTSISLETRNSLITTLQCSTMTIVLSPLVTGCHPWTIYEYDSYRGYAMCLYPESTAKCTPGFYSTRQSLGRLANQVSSVRKGCYAKHKLLPDNHGLTVRGGHTGGIGRMEGSWFNQGNES